MKIFDVVDFDRIKNHLSRCTKKRAKATLERLLPDQDMTLDEALWGVDMSNYTDIPADVMTAQMYERLVPVHMLERGMLPVIYAFNSKGFRRNTYIQSGHGDYLFSTDIITMMSCTGHRIGELQTGRDIGQVKSGFIEFYLPPKAPKRQAKECGAVVNLFRDKSYLFYDGRTDTDKLFQIELTDEGCREFWNDVIETIGEYNSEVGLKNSLVDEIRPKYDIKSRTLSNFL